MPVQSPEYKIKQRIAIFASGAGSNARKIIQYFENHPFITVALVVCNKPGAGVLSVAANAGIDVLMIEKEQFFRGNGYVDELKSAGIDAIILAGFLWKVPANLIQAYARKILNIHPALLPAYGGKGLYGRFVHESVLAAREKQSGISIHIVDEFYDHGDVIFQAKVDVDDNDTPDSLAEKIHLLEHQHYPQQIEKFLQMSTGG